MKSAKLPICNIGIIGGTGLYDIDNIKVISKIDIKTAWGKPSAKITIAEYGDTKTKIAFLPRHGDGHHIIPSQIPQKANMAALKMLGVKNIIAFSAVGSLKEEIAPTHFIIPDQIIDRTRHRPDTFYGDGIVVHVTFGDPFCNNLAEISKQAFSETSIKYHTNETLVCMEGPQFSTRAESKLYKSWGAGLINMSAIPEAKLARELEICYQMICMSTDYDSWRDSDEAVTTEEILSTIKENSANANVVLQALLPKLIREQENCDLVGSIKNSIITAPDKRPNHMRKKLNSVLPGYF